MENSPRVGFPAAHRGVLTEPKQPGLRLRRLMFGIVSSYYLIPGMSAKEVTTDAPANSEGLVS